jgi:hypothetical protein
MRKLQRKKCRPNGAKRERQCKTLKLHDEICQLHRKKLNHHDANRKLRRDDLELHF